MTVKPRDERTKTLANTEKDIAEWMMKELERDSNLVQEIAVHKIKEKFGEKYTYLNDNGNPAIDKKVLREFKKLGEESVVWDRYALMWRFRTEHDFSGRQQS